MMTTAKRATLPVTLALLLTACGGGQETGNEIAANTTEEVGHPETAGRPACEAGGPGGTGPASRSSGRAWRAAAGC